MIPAKQVQEILDATRIEDVVGEFVNLRKRGINLTGLCPFHNEKTPSFNVSPSRGIYKCFGCGEAGNSVRFIMDHEKLSYPETIRYLAKKYHIDVEEEYQPEDVKQEIQEKESLLLVNQWAAEFFAQQLWETENGKAVAYSYFRERGFTDETIKKFQLGFHPDGWSNYTDAAQKAGYKLEYMVKTGLTIEKDDKHFDRFRNRVMFPIHNISGKVIGFGGRILGNDKKQAKYLNSPESDVYHKSSVLYGIHLARKTMMGDDEAFLVEGYTDVIALHQAGIDNVVSSSGTSLTVDQVKIILRYTKNVTILYDGDPAGIKASFRGIDMILEQGMNVKIVMFPEGEDPDSFARNNTPAYVKGFIKTEAKDFIAFKTTILRQEAQGDPIRTAEMIREIIHSLALIPDPILRSLYVKECSARLQMEEQVLINELNKQIRSNQKKTADRPPDFEPEELDEFGFPVGSKIDPAPKVEAYHAEAQENDLIRILIRHANKILVFHDVDDKKKPIDLQIRVGDFILNELFSDQLDPENLVLLKICEIFSESTGDDFPEESFFLHHPDPVISRTSINLTSNPHLLSEHWKEMHQIHITDEETLLRKAVMTAVYSYKIRRVLMMLKSANERLSTGLDEVEMYKTLERSKQLEEVKLALAKQLSYVIL